MQGQDDLQSQQMGVHCLVGMDPGHPVVFQLVADGLGRNATVWSVTQILNNSIGRTLAVVGPQSGDQGAEAGLETTLAFLV